MSSYKAQPALPISTPIVGPTGHVTEVWASFFNRLYSRAGSGSPDSPKAITAAVGILHAGKWDEITFVTGSGGPVDISANPQIAAGLWPGQTLTLIGTSDTNTVKMDSGTGTSQTASITLTSIRMISYVWNGTVWSEQWRRS